MGRHSSDDVASGRLRAQDQQHLREQIGSRLRREGVRLDLTAEEIASRVGCSRRTWQYYESGNSMPSADLLNQLDTLGFDILYVVTGRSGLSG